MNQSEMAQTVHISKGTNHDVETDFEGCWGLLFLNTRTGTTLQLVKSLIPTKGKEMNCPDRSTRCLFFRFLSIKLWIPRIFYLVSSNFLRFSFTFSSLTANLLLSEASSISLWFAIGPLPPCRVMIFLPSFSRIPTAIRTLSASYTLLLTLVYYVAVSS